MPNSLDNAAFPIQRRNWHHHGANVRRFCYREDCSCHNIRGDLALCACETNMATTHMCPTHTTHQLTGKLHDSLDESRQAFATVQVLDSNGRGADTHSCSPSCGTNFDRDGTHTLRRVGTSGVPGKSLKPILTTTAGTPLSPNLGSVIVSFSDGDSPQVPVQQASRLHRGLSSHSAHAWCPSVHWQRWLCFVPSHGSLPVRRCSEHGSAV